MAAMTDKPEDHPFARAFLAALQIAGIALGLLIVSEMLWENANSIPARMCVDANPSPSKSK
jgi:hypothetical protein